MSSAAQTIFNSIPDQDYLGIRPPGGDWDTGKVLDLLDFRKRDVAAAARVPLNSVRFDQQMPKLVKEHLEKWEVALQLVGKHFRGDAEKTALWFKTPNYMLGGIAPRDMIRFGRFKKLLELIQSSLEENAPAS